MMMVVFKYAALFSRWMVAARALFLRKMVEAQALFQNLPPDELVAHRLHAGSARETDFPKN